MKLKPPGNPKAVELIKSSLRRSNLSDLHVLKKDDKRYCCWCYEGEVKKSNAKYCSPECRDSAFISFNPQKEEGLHTLLIRQGFKCGQCGYDYEPLIDGIIKKSRAKMHVVEKDRPCWYLMKRLKRTTPAEHKPEVDHIVPLYKGGIGLGLDNHQALCYTCHKAKTKKDVKKA